MFPSRPWGHPGRGSSRCRIVDQVVAPFDAVETVVHPVEPSVDLGDVDSDLCNGAFQGTQAQALLALFLANQTYFLEQAATLLGDEFETDLLITHQGFVWGGAG